jgi:hypothetical protein
MHRLSVLVAGSEGGLGLVTELVFSQPASVSLVSGLWSVFSSAGWAYVLLPKMARVRCVSHKKSQPTQLSDGACV